VPLVDSGHEEKIMADDRTITDGQAEGSMMEPDDAPQESMLTPEVPPPDMAPDSTADDAGDAGTTGSGGSPEKDPSDWVTGDEAMTGPQRSYLATLSRDAGEEFDASLTKAQASERIDELQTRTGRGQGS